MARTLEIVGEKWALLAVREVFLGNRRFDEMVRKTGAPRDTMTARLKTLVAAGVLERRPVSEHPPRFEYRLTQAGLDLYPVIVSLMQWGDRYLERRRGAADGVDASLRTRRWARSRRAHRVASRSSRATFDRRRAANVSRGDLVVD